MIPWLLTMVVRFGEIFMFMFNLSATTGKYSFVISSLVVRSHSCCHVPTLITTLFGTFL